MHRFYETFLVGFVAALLTSLLSGNALLAAVAGGIGSLVGLGLASITGFKLPSPIVRKARFESPFWRKFWSLMDEDWNGKPGDRQQKGRTDKQRVQDRIVWQGLVGFHLLFCILSGIEQYNDGASFLYGFALPIAFFGVLYLSLFLVFIAYTTARNFFRAIAFYFEE